MVEQRLVDQRGLLALRKKRHGFIDDPRIAQDTTVAKPVDPIEADVIARCGIVLRMVDGDFPVVVSMQHQSRHRGLGESGGADIVLERMPGEMFDPSCEASV
jgi:hypothetical protein